jgi:hypothetical protein
VLPDGKSQHLAAGDLRQQQVTGFLLPEVLLFAQHLIIGDLQQQPLTSSSPAMFSRTNTSLAIFSSNL